MADRHDWLRLEPNVQFGRGLEDRLVERLRSTSTGVPSDDADLVILAERRTSSTRRRRLIAVATLALVALATVGLVVRSRQPTEEKTTLTTPIASADLARLLGPVRSATREPVVVGFVSDEEDAGVLTSAEAALAAVSYVNEHLGGIAGHPLQLVTCTTGDARTDADARACAERLVAARPVVVLQSRSLQGTTIESVVSLAGIPFLAFDVGDLAGRVADSYLLVSVDAAGLAPVAIAQAAHVSRAAVVTTDVGGLPQLIESGQQGYYDAAGVTVSFLSVAADGSDAAAMARAVVGSDAQQVQVVAEDPTCIAVLDALRDAGYRRPVYVNPGCLDSQPALSGAVDLSGVVRIGPYATNPDGVEGRLYRAVLTAYASTLTPQGRYAAGGYAVVVALARALGGLQGEITPAAVRSTLDAMPDTPMPLIDGVTFRCRDHGAPDTTADCTRTVTAVELGPDGTPGRARSIDVSAVLSR